ncbi:hypothetical protein MA16_Dca016062 [Dendrobium catenatum]|uniref:Uncharacterized protein n=1 Tax=Dendrobium catenatum TaxID=906689 RepID=A0A2I0VEL8_9ASPA|nr:hypothetical protein MA16_Dca016062 [Dendrobium catenatum]
MNGRAELGRSIGVGPCSQVSRRSSHAVYGGVREERNRARRQGPDCHVVGASRTDLWAQEGGEGRRVGLLGGGKHAEEVASVDCKATSAGSSARYCSGILDREEQRTFWQVEPVGLVRPRDDKPLGV